MSKARKKGPLKGSSIIDPIGEKNILEKQVPKNKRYSKVKGKLDTGMNINKLKKKLGSQTWNTRYKKKENFKRIKRIHLSRLLQDPEEQPYLLLLDIRDDEEYKTCHIQTAKSYPKRFLNHSVNEFKVVPEIFLFKNKSDKAIVVYSYEEERGIWAASKFFEKGFDNVMLLSGGLLRFSEKYGHLVEGKIPRKSKKKKKKKSWETESVASYMTRAGDLPRNKKNSARSGDKKENKFVPSEHVWK